MAARTTVSARLPSRASFWILAVTLGFLLFASSAPSPMYVIYQEQWHFAASVLTAVYATNAVCLMLALLCFGRLSDHLGRRPVLGAALVVQIAAMAVFASAGNEGWLFAARALQGIATGLAIGALSASLLDFQPSGGRLGALMTNVSSSGGLAVGALGSGLLVQYAPSPTQLVYWLLAGVYAAAVLGVLAMPEPVHGDGRWVRSLRPHVGVPSQVRGVFATSPPSVIAAWALPGLYLSLGGSLAVADLGLRTHLAGALVVVAVSGTGALVAVLSRSWSSERAASFGSAVMIVGVGTGLAAVNNHSAALFFVASVIAGIGIGTQFSGALRAITTAAPASQRAEVVTATYVVAYLALSVPAVIAGVVAARYGLVAAANGYGVALIALALCTLGLSLRTRQARGGPAQDAVSVEVPCPGTGPAQHRDFDSRGYAQGLRWRVAGGVPAGRRGELLRSPVSGKRQES